LWNYQQIVVAKMRPCDLSLAIHPQQYMLLTLYLKTLAFWHHSFNS
jgi:hypothetical protein